MSDGQGTFLGRYRLGEVLGRGAMGVVYEASDPKLKGRKVAIKTILKSQLLDPQMAAEYSARFDTEAGNVASLNHPNIVTVYDFGNEADVAYLVMEFIDGKELKSYLDAKHLFGIDEAVGIVCHLLDALDYAHEKFIYHRDIKPANVMIDVRGRVKLTDFGVARQSDGTGNDGTRAGTMVGTPSYMSPEQIKGLPAQAAADLFATGVVLYQCLTLHKPFTGGSEWEIWQKIVNEDPPPLSQYRDGVPPALERALLRALAKDPKERPPSAGAMIADLRASIAGASFDPDATRIVGKPVASTARDESSMRPAAAATRSGSGTGSQRVATVAPAYTQQNNEIELEFWRSIKDSGDREEFQLFLERFPAGTYSDLARRKMSKLGGTVVADDTDASMARQIEEQEAKVRQMRADQERRIAEAERERELARQRVEEARLEQIRLAEEARLREEAEARARAEEEARLAEQVRLQALEAERIAAAQREAARIKAEEDAARAKAAEEVAARARAAEEEAKRVAEADARRIEAAKQEARRLKEAEEEAARLKAAAEQEAARIKAAEEKAARVKAEQEAARIQAEQEAARMKAVEEAARVKAAEEAARVKAAEEKAASIKADDEAARIKAQQEAARIKAAEEKAALLKAEEEAARARAAEEEAALNKAAEEKAARAMAAEEAAARDMARAEEAARAKAAEQAVTRAKAEAEAARIAAAEDEQDATRLRKPEDVRLAEEQWAAAQKRADEKEAQAEAQRRREAKIAESAPSADEATRVIRPSDRARRVKAPADADKKKAEAEAAAAEAAREQQERQAAEAKAAAEQAQAAAAERERQDIASAIGQEVKEVGAARTMGAPPRAVGASKTPLFLGIGAAVLVLAGGAFMLTSKKEPAPEARSVPAQPDRAVVVEPAPPPVPSGPARIITPPQTAPAAASAVASAPPPPTPDPRAEKEAAKRTEAQRLADLKAKDQKEQKELAARKAVEDAKLAEENKTKDAAALKLREDAAKAAAVRDEAAKKELAAKAKAKELADQKAKDDAAAQHAKELAEQKARDEEKARAAAQKVKVKADPDALFAQAQRADQEGRSREAVDLYKQAYGAGSGRAARMLGDIYGKGSGDVGRDYSEQLQWYEKAKAAGVDVPTPGKRKY